MNSFLNGDSKQNSAKVIPPLDLKSEKFGTHSQIVTPSTQRYKFRNFKGQKNRYLSHLNNINIDQDNMSTMDDSFWTPFDSSHIQQIDEMQRQEILKAEQQSKIRVILKIISQKNNQKIDIKKLRQLCVSKHGLVNEELRRTIWPLLLNAEVIFNDELENNEGETPTGSTISTAQKTSGIKNYLKELRDDCSWSKYSKLKHRESEQIAKDINRSLNTFQECTKWSKTIKNIRRAQLSKIIHAILNKNDALNYYQGFHDFVSVFLLTLGENLGFHCANIASNFLIRDYMKKSFDQGVMPTLDLANKLLQLVDQELWDLVELTGGQPVFALSWLLTWFSHDVESLEKVQRIFDACLATHPLFCVYITVAFMEISKTSLIEYECPEISGHAVFKEMKENQSFNIEEAIELGYIYFKKYPIEEVYKMVEEENKNETRKRFLFEVDSPCIRYQMEKMYLKNKRLICYEDPNKKSQENQSKNTVAKQSLLVMTVFGMVLMGAQLVERMNADKSMLFGMEF